MLDFKFNWDTSIETRNDVIDTQHKELFRIGRAVEQLVITKCIGVEEKYMLDIVCSLREYAAFHFYQEEHLMELYHIEELEEHRAKHDEYRKMILEIDMKKLSEEPYGEMLKMKSALTEAIFTHVLLMDQQMTKKIKERMNQQ